MKTVRRVTLSMRVIGILLLVVALTLTSYTALLCRSARSELKTKMEEVGCEVSRSSFDTVYLRALIKAAKHTDGTQAERNREIMDHFAQERIRWESALDARRHEDAEEAIGTLLADFDAAPFLEKCALREDDAEQRMIDAAYEYLDSLSGGGKPSLKKGKSKGGSAAKASEIFPPLYEALCEEHTEEEVGTYAEFLEAVRRLIADVSSDGTQVIPADFMAQGFTFEAYSEYLHLEEQEEEEAEEESYLTALENLAGEVFTREGLDGFFSAQAARLNGDDPEAERDALITVTVGILEDPSGFDGSYDTLGKLVRSGIAASGSFESFLQSFARGTVAKSDEFNSVGFLVFVWKLGTIRIWFWIAGAVLVILSVVLKKTMTASMMRKAEFTHTVTDPDVLLEVSHLKQYFRSGSYVNKAVDDVSFTIKKGEVFGLVGESGCGKTTTGRTIIDLYDPTDGDVYFRGLRISSNLKGYGTLRAQKKSELKNALRAMKAQLSRDLAKEPAKADQLRREYREKTRVLRQETAEELYRLQKHAYESEEEKRRSRKQYRADRAEELKREYERDIASLTGTEKEERTRRYEAECRAASKDDIMSRMQMIFQDPIASINPRMTVREIIAEGLRIRGIRDKKYIDEKVYEMLELVGLVREHADRYPHEFSGGQRQRIGIARAIVLQPELIIADEPISALDVSIQAQVINLLNDLRERMGLTILFIAHNLSVVKYFSDRIAVMYFGHIVEMAPSDELFAHPLHPYTRSLLSAIPYPDPLYEKERKRIEYNPALQHDYSKEGPTFREITPGHFIRCNTEEFEAYRKELGL